MIKNRGGKSPKPTILKVKMDKKEKEINQIKIQLLPVGKQTPSGRIYTESVLKKSIQRFFTKAKHLLVVNKINDSNPDHVTLSNVIGQVSKKGCIVTDKEFFIDITFLNVQMAKDIFLVVSQGRANFVPIGCGIVDPKTNKVKNYHLLYIYLEEKK